MASASGSAFVVQITDIGLSCMQIIGYYMIVLLMLEALFG